MTHAATRLVSPPTTIGVLAGWVQSDVIGGLVGAAQAAAVNLVYLNATALHAPFAFGDRRNVAYDLACSGGIDGLVVVPGTLGSHMGLDELAQYCERYRPLPMSSVAHEMAGMTSILIDGEPALRDGIRHLVEDHHYRRFAFLGGPAANREARARLQTFMDALTGFGLRPPEASVVVGDWQYESGVEAVRILLDERAASFDAIVAANDPMAAGVIDGLRARGLRVPRDVAVMGFDDVAEARYSAPPLTTVRQPLEEQGRLAVEVLLRRLRGEVVDDVIVLPTQLVIRRSCGCSSDLRPTERTSHPAASLTGSGTDLSVDAELRLRRDRILGAMRAAASDQVDGIPEAWLDELLDTLMADLRSENAGFVELVNTQLEEVLHAGGTGNAWLPALSTLRKELIPCLVSDPAMRLGAEDLLQAALILVGDAVEHTQAQRRLTNERRARALGDAAELLGAALDLASLGVSLRECLPRLGVPSAYLMLDDGRSPGGARLAFAFDDARDPAGLARLGAAPIGSPFAGGALLTTGRPHPVVVTPLFFQEDPFGYAVFEMGPVEGLVYDALREQISGALKVALLITELQARAAELQDAYGALQDNQQRLLSSEKMASLGRITANIAHEMNTPLAAVRAALSEIDKRATEYEASVGDEEVTAEDHLQIAAEMRAAIQLARSAAERAAGFIRGIKTQTRDLAPQDRVRFDPVPVIEESLLLLSYDIRRASGGVRFEPPERPIELLGTPGRLSQIVTNLVTNALDALPEEGAGSVTLRLTADDHAARLEVQDTGTGIPPELREKIFEAMFTTKPVEQGTGLGLSIVKDLVDGHFRGRIEVASEPGQGTTFTLTFPLAGER